MSKDEIHDIANKDTPAAVDVPKNLQGLIMWGVIRFGGSALVAGVFALAAMEVYKDMRADRAQLLEAYRENTRVIEGFARTIEAQSRAIENAHLRAGSGR